MKRDTEKRVVMVPRELLDEMVSLLDRHLGDTDITHLDDDEDLKRVAPAQWVCTQLAMLSAAHAKQARAKRRGK